MVRSTGRGECGRAQYAVRLLALAVFAGGLLWWPHGALAAWEPSVRVLRAGLYELNATGRVCDERGCPTVNVTFVNGTNLVPDRLFSRFGFEFITSLHRVPDPEPTPATPTIGRLYETVVAPHERRAREDGLLTPPDSEPPPRFMLLTARILHPPVKSPIRGKLQSAQTWDFRVCPDVPAYVGWEFTFDWERAEGEWVLELLHKGRVLAVRRFQCVPEGFHGSLNLSYAVGERERETDEAASAPCQPRAAAPGHAGNATAAGATLETAQEGQLRVRVGTREEAVNTPGAGADGPHCLLVAAVLGVEEARRIGVLLEEKGFPVTIRKAGRNVGRTAAETGTPQRVRDARGAADGGVYKVLVGPYGGRKAADDAAAGLLVRMGRPARVVPGCCGGDCGAAASGTAQ